ncbi:MAG: hypothetical protein NTY18_08335, partial [Deltaproteobacteria bacterium]|nr:hypothetical protein [Deltaproteobacteria bacterium]
MLTPAENLKRLFAKQPADYVPLFDSPWGDTMTKWVKQGYPTVKNKRKVKEKVVEDGKEVEREIEKEFDDPVNTTEHFGF